MIRSRFAAERHGDANVSIASQLQIHLDLKSSFGFGLWRMHLLTEPACDAAANTSLVVVLWH